MAVRSIPMNSRSVTGRIPVTGQGAVAVESTLERDFALLAQFQRGFIAIEEQPVRIPIPEPGRGYVPDFLVTWAPPRPRELVEVKYQADLESNLDRLAPRFAAAERFACDNGWIFVVATESDIRTPQLGNAKFLLPFRRRAVDPGLCARLIAGVAVAGTISAGQLLEITFPIAARIEALPALWRLIATFQLGADLTTPLTMDSQLTIGESGHA